MTITYGLLVMFLVSAAVNFYRDFLKAETEEMSRLTWDACLHPGGAR